MADLKTTDLTVKYLKAVFDNLDTAAKAVQQKGQSQVANLTKAAGYVQRIMELHVSMDTRSQNTTGWAVPYPILHGDPDGIYFAAWNPLRQKYKWVKETVLPHYHVTSIPTVKAKFVPVSNIVLMTFVGLQQQPESFIQNPTDIAVNDGIDAAGVDIPEEAPPEVAPEEVNPTPSWISTHRTTLIVAGVAGALTLGAVIYGLTREKRKNPGAGGKDWEEAWQRLQEAWDYHLSGDDKAHVRLRLAEAKIHAKRLPQGMRDLILEKVSELKEQI